MAKVDSSAVMPQLSDEQVDLILDAYQTKLTENVMVICNESERYRFKLNYFREFCRDFATRGQEIYELFDDLAVYAREMNTMRTMRFEKFLEQHSQMSDGLLACTELISDLEVMIQNIQQPKYLSPRFAETTGRSSKHSLEYKSSSNTTDTTGSNTDYSESTNTSIFNYERLERFSMKLNELNIKIDKLEAILNEIHPDPPTLVTDPTELKLMADIARNIAEAVFKLRIRLRVTYQRVRMLPHESDTRNSRNAEQKLQRRTLYERMMHAQLASTQTEFNSAELFVLGRPSLMGAPRYMPVSKAISAEETPRLSRLHAILGEKLAQWQPTFYEHGTTPMPTAVDTKAVLEQHPTRSKTETAAKKESEEEEEEEKLENGQFLDAARTRPSTTTSTTQASASGGGDGDDGDDNSAVKASRARPPAAGKTALKTKMTTTTQKSGTPLASDTPLPISSTQQQQQQPQQQLQQHFQPLLFSKLDFLPSSSLGALLAGTTATTTTYAPISFIPTIVTMATSAALVHESIAAISQASATTTTSVIASPLTTTSFAFGRTFASPLKQAETKPATTTTTTMTTTSAFAPTTTTTTAAVITTSAPITTTTTTTTQGSTMPESVSSASSLAAPPHEMMMRTPERFVPPSTEAGGIVQSGGNAGTTTTIATTTTTTTTTISAPASTTMLTHIPFPTAATTQQQQQVVASTTALTPTPSTASTVLSATPLSSRIIDFSPAAAAAAGRAKLASSPSTTEAASTPTRTPLNFQFKVPSSESASPASSGGAPQPQQQSLQTQSPQLQAPSVQQPQQPPPMQQQSRPGTFFTQPLAATMNDDGMEEDTVTETISAVNFSFNRAGLGSPPVSSAAAPSTPRNPFNMFSGGAPKPSLFAGGSSSTTGGTSMFGGGSPAAVAQPQQQTSMFGGGTAAAGAQSSFGQPTSGTAFGSGPTFGNASPFQRAPQVGGCSPQVASSGGGFTAFANRSSGFGQLAANQQQQQQQLSPQSGGSLFATAAPIPQGQSMFGGGPSFGTVSSFQQQQPSGTQSLFGGGPASSPATGGGPFSGYAANSSFGQMAQQQQQSPSLFGPRISGGSSLFGGGPQNTSASTTTKSSAFTTMRK